MIDVFNINDRICIGLLDLKSFSITRDLKTKRELETFGKNYLITQLLGKSASIKYSNTGKPYLEGDTRFVSISHSHDKLAVIINNKENAGIDIELIRDKVINIKHKFLSASELENAENDIEKLLIYWSAKETLYKIYGKKEVDFIRHLHINPFIKEESGEIIGEINMPNNQCKYILQYQKIDNYILVYSSHKIIAC
jgi:4'-phosphopantetheinyl transferase